MVWRSSGRVVPPLAAGRSPTDDFSSRSTTQKTKEKARNIIEDIKRKQKEEGISDELLEDDDSVENNQ